MAAMKIFVILAAVFLCGVLTAPAPASVEAPKADVPVPAESTADEPVDDEEAPKADAQVPAESTADEPVDDEVDDPYYTYTYYPHYRYTTTYYRNHGYTRQNYYNGRGQYTYRWVYRGDAPKEEGAPKADAQVPEESTADEQVDDEVDDPYYGHSNYYYKNHYYTYSTAQNSYYSHHGYQKHYYYVNGNRTYRWVRYGDAPKEEDTPVDEAPKGEAPKDTEEAEDEK